MEMKVKDGLSGNNAVIGKEIVPFNLQTLQQCTCNNPGCLKKGMIGLIRQVQEIIAMLLRQDQCVAQMNGIDIENRDNFVVLVENFRRNFF
jgi:hypothetical protein